MFEARFISAWDETLSDVPRISVGLINQKYPSVVARVLVESANQPLLIIYVCGNNDDYFFKEAALVWKHCVVIGVGRQVTFINLADHASTTTRLGCYFAYLYPTDDLLLVASACYLHCFEVNGHLRWVSEHLGIDGVVVQQIADGTVRGLGEWDPPSGWKPFNVSLATGRLLP